MAQLSREHCFLFLKAGLIDELSLTVYPGIDGLKGVPTIFEYEGKEDERPTDGQRLELLSATTEEGGLDSDDKPAQGNGYPNGIKSEKAMKKVIILSSSPRKGGNSDLLCDRFMEGALSAGHQVEKLFLYDYEINDFIANDSLADHTDRNAADDVPMIMDKLVAADVIVLATPVYYYTMCGRMKTMIDRTYSRHRELKGKEFYYIITAAVRDKNRLQRTVEEFRGFLDCLPSPQECGIIYGMGTHNKGSVMGMPVMQEAYDMGKEI